MDPIILFWFSLIFVIVIGIGLLIDLILVALYWDKLQNIFTRKLKEVPWLLKDVFFIIFSLVIVYWIFSLLGYITIKTDILTKEGLKVFSSIINTFGIYLLGIFIIIKFVKIKYRVSWDTLGIKKYRWVDKCLKSVFLYLGFIPIFIILAHIGILICNLAGIKPEAHPLVDILKKEKSVWYIVYLVLTASIIAPLFEELVFRGFFYQSLKKNLGIFKAIIITSIIFSILHFNMAQFLPVFALGVLLCSIFEFSGSLVPAIFIHMLNNTICLGLFLMLKEYI